MANVKVSSQVEEQTREELKAPAVESQQSISGLHTEASVICDDATELWFWRRQLFAADGGCCAGRAGFADDFRSLRH